MAAVAGNALVFGHWLMLNLVLRHFGADIIMAVETDLACLLFDKIGLISAMRAMTG